MMNKKLYIAALALAAVLPATAQDTYESARLIGSDLNGTARYVGMGGAMEALGADISTMSTNPAGIGLMRHSTASVSFGLVSQNGVEEFDGLGKTHMSFDQAGIVYSSRVSRRSFVNVGFNYHKSRNFDQILSAANSLFNSSQNGLSYKKHRNRSEGNGGFWLDFNTDNGSVVGWRDKNSNTVANTFSQADFVNVNALMYDGTLYKEVYDRTYDDPFNPDLDWVFYNDADQYMFDRAHRGWISEFDFNVSGNQSDRFYWGVTVGVYDVNYKGYSLYSEGLVGHYDDETTYDAGIVHYMDDRKIDGTGVDVKAGIIFRPLEESPFRIGLSVTTPTWYELTTSNETLMLNDAHGAPDEKGQVYPIGEYDDAVSSETYDFRYFTPWKFGASIGHTVGTDLAFGLSYEVSDYSASDNRILSGERNSSGYERSYKDSEMKQNAKRSLKAVHLFKAGLEYKPDPALALRLGYNYQSAAYEKNGVRDNMLNSPGVAYASTTDYVNWGDTHRFTCGAGYKTGGWNFDIAYQYSTVKGDFHPFQAYDTNQSTGVKEVKNNRHQVLMTVGYTF